MKKYRIDVFYLTGNHKKEYFDSIGEAVRYAARWGACGARVFLLQHVLDGYYDIVDQLF